MPRPRTPAAVLLAVAALACANVSRAGDEARLRRQLNGYQLPRPLAAVWPEALRVLAARGVELTGKDRATVGQAEESGVGELLSKGFATRDLGGGRWVAETDTFRANLRYRVQGTDLGQGRAIVRYFLVQWKPDLGQEDVSRELELELALVKRVDPAAAERMAGAP